MRRGREKGPHAGANVLTTPVLESTSSAVYAPVALVVPKEKGSDRIVARVRASSGGRSRGGGQRWAMAAVERRGGRFSRDPTFGFTPIRLFPTGDLDFRSFHSHPRRIRTARWVGPGAKGRRQVGPVRCGWCGKWGRVPTCGHALALVGAGKEGGVGWVCRGSRGQRAGTRARPNQRPVFQPYRFDRDAGWGGRTRTPRTGHPTTLFVVENLPERIPPATVATSVIGASTYELWTWAVPIERREARGSG